MRGSALRAPAGRVPPVPPCGLRRAVCPVDPDQEVGLAPSLDHPASEPSRSDTMAQRVRPFGIRAQGALLPKTPARKEGIAPFPPYPHIRRVVLR